MQTAGKPQRRHRYSSTYRTSAVLLWFCFPEYRRPAFTMASSDGEIYTIDELIKRRAAELQNATLLGYPKEGLIDYEEHSAIAVDKYVDAAVQTLLQRGLKPADSTLKQAPTIGILAHSSLHFVITLLAISRLGYATLLLSTRLASPAIIRLLELADCDTILTTNHYHAVLAEVHAQRNVTLYEMLQREDYFGIDAPVFTRQHDPEFENPKHAVIIHSSGSTGLPKPIYLTHRSCIAAFSTHLDRRAMMTQPLFHSFGFYETFRSIYSGKPMYYVNYAFPLTKHNLTTAAAYIKPEVLFCVPYVLKLFAESEEGIKCLAAINLVMYGGSACPDDLGHKLVDGGVNLVANYGATETSRLMTSVRPAGDKGWDYLRILPEVKQWVLMDEIAPGIFECVALDGLRSKSTINSDDPPNSFRTRDLFMRHPTEDWWKYVSRLDDRLTLVNGEKVLPIPIEGRIRQESLVKEAIVFGDGKTIPGVLIIKADTASSIPDDEYKQQIWPAIEDANSRAESFSRIPQDLVVILPADATYAATDKGTFIRAQVYTQYQPQIEAAYAAFENDTSADPTEKVALSVEELEPYLLRRFREHLDIALPSTTTDFFAFDVDSLQCMKMWSLIKKEIDLSGHQDKLGQNILYETGNIAALARHLYSLRTGTSDDDATTDTAKTMHDLIAKYSVFKPWGPPQPFPRLVLLTGVTGGLGAHILSHLVQDPSVTEIWCLVRASSDDSALSRTLSSLSSRGIALTPTQRWKVFPFAADLSKPDFGLGEHHLQVLKSKLTLVIHSAWAVNFNISVRSFEDQHIRTVQSLINLCQSVYHGAPARPARFLFCSSVSSAAATPRPGTVAEAPVAEARFVQGTGYAQSKYVAEHIVLNAAKNAGADARVLRIGQLVGDTKVGEWNTTEGIPLMIQTALTLGALPMLDEEMSWLPVDYAARIILDLATDATAASSEAERVFHVLNPTRFHWTRDMLPALRDAGLEFEALRTEEWMERLRSSEKDPEKNPPIKLLEWFESKYGYGARGKKTGVLEYETGETARMSATIERLPDVTDRAYVGRVVGRLRRHWGA
ncbi:acetyl-CoA synthetase-like protein [Byssothecium circinans]|uniref:Acetyl-CoA synthetase-like protein n=1 Tax=Byssothecium circinans TaxID=147558 RepID=A0A6A5TIC4_9PLEO|nr:acetyl-CoA synthetase-like protein [Byssothecium circinans]